MNDYRATEERIDPRLCTPVCQRRIDGGVHSGINANEDAVEVIRDGDVLHPAVNNGRLAPRRNEQEPECEQCDEVAFHGRWGIG